MSSLLQPLKGDDSQGKNKKTTWSFNPFTSDEQDEQISTTPRTLNPFRHSQQSHQSQHDDDNEHTDNDNDNTTNDICPTLSWQQRLTGFFLCFGVGVLMSLLSLLSFGDMIAGYPAAFAIRFSLGNLMSVGATCFIVGPRRQLRNMSNKTRLIASIVFVGSLFLTLFFAFRVQVPILVIVCMVVQWAAVWWYSLSYVPYGRRIASNFIASMV
eukprot:GHVR01184299.1.p1 GENE.GHVR01184299.1~~GHVR01184299.1.p1  ORF type:complete len:212 (-),score=33.20 GHVR01184299.1:138-773(-)